MDSSASDCDASWTVRTQTNKPNYHGLWTYKYGKPLRPSALCSSNSLRAHVYPNLQQLIIMVVKLQTVSALYADVYPSIKSRREMESIVTDCPRRQKRQVALPALVEDETEEVFETEKRSYLLHTEGLRRQKSVSPQRQRLRRSLALPSLSEDEEPWSSRSGHQEWSHAAGCLLRLPESWRSLKVK